MKFLSIITISIVLACPVVPKKQSGFDSFLSDLGVILGSTGSTLATPFTSFGDLLVSSLTPFFVKRAVTGELSKLNLPVESRERIYRFLDSKKFEEQFIPFLMELKDLYNPDSGDEGFDSWARRTYKNSDIPGLDHSLFTRELKEEKGAGVGLPPELLTQLVILFDSMFIQLDDWDLNNPVKITKEQISRSIPSLKKALQIASVALAGDGNAIGEVAKGVKFIIDDDKALENVTISLAFFIQRILYRHQSAIHRRGEKVEERKKELLAKLDKNELLDDVRTQMNKKNKAVHVVVDGLQGHLVKALAQNDKKFLKTIDEENTDAIAQSKPLTEEVLDAPAQNNEFLKFLVENPFEDPNYLVQFKEIYQQGKTVEQGISTTPTISVRNIPIAQTGANAAGDISTNIPNFHWVQRNSEHIQDVIGSYFEGFDDISKEPRPFYFYGNDALWLDVIATDGGMKTLFESFGGTNCWGVYDKGSDFILSSFLNLGIGEKARDFGMQICLKELNKRLANEKKLRSLRIELLENEEAINSEDSFFNFSRGIQRNRAKNIINEIAELEQRSIDDYFHLYNPWPDHFAHFSGAFNNETTSPTGELNRLDYWLKRFTDIYKEAGYYPTTLFGMAGDHGMSPVYYLLNPENSVKKTLDSKGINLKYTKISSDEGQGPKLNHPLYPPSMKGYDMVVASTAGGNYMMDFFVDQEENFERQPLNSDLENLRLLDGNIVNMVEIVRESLPETLGYMALRETDPTQDRSVTRLVATRDGQRIDEFITREENRYFYQSNGDLVGLHELSPYVQFSQKELSQYEDLKQKCLIDAKKENSQTWCDRDQWMELTRFSKRPDSVVQLSHLYDNPRAGTINLFPKDFIGYNSKVPGRHAGESFHEKDSFVGFWGGAGDLLELPNSAVLGSVPATLSHFLSGESQSAGIQFPSLMK